MSGGKGWNDEYCFLQELVAKLLAKHPGAVPLRAVYTVSEVGNPTVSDRLTYDLMMMVMKLMNDDDAIVCPFSPCFWPTANEWTCRMP